METIQENINGLKIVVGSKAVIVADANGKVLVNKPASNRPTMTIAPAVHIVKVGTTQEILAEKTVQDIKYAPVKAQKEAEILALKSEALLGK